jgi:hypothetical protein
MLAARVEQKNEQTRREKMVCTTLDKESPIQAVCGKAARTVLCGGRAMKRASLPLQRLFAATLARSTMAELPLLGSPH